MSDTLEVQVWRGDKSGHFEHSQAPTQENQPVLNVIPWIQRHSDPTLSFRSCRIQCVDPVQ